MARDSSLRSSRLQWLHSPARPSEATLEQLREVFGRRDEIREAWLLRHRVTPDRGDPHEETAVAMVVEGVTEPPSHATVELVAELLDALRPVLDVGSCIFVNNAIRPKTERHGVKVFQRSSD
jgi:hypothetical protein